MTTTDDHAARPRRYLVLLLVALTAMLIDLATKQWALASFTEGESVDVIGSFLQFTLVFNTGAAFSMGTDYTWVFTIIASLVVLAIAYMGLRVRSLWWAVTLGLMMGGAAGNLIDRFFRGPDPFQGAVVDFIRLPNWPVFNLADSSVVVGACLVVLLTFKGINLDGSLVSDEKDEKDEKKSGPGGEEGRESSAPGQDTGQGSAEGSTSSSAEDTPDPGDSSSDDGPGEGTEWKGK